MIPTTGPDPSRREFLAAAGALAAASLGVQAAQTPQLERAAPPAPARAEGDGKITSTTVSEASRLAGIEFTEPEREMMARTLPRQVATFKSRQKAGFLSNELAPAMVF